MTEILKTDNANNRIMYTFRFSTSNELARIPKLSALVEEYPNEKDGYIYILNPPSNYSRFTPILHSITSLF